MSRKLVCRDSRGLSWIFVRCSLWEVSDASPRNVLHLSLQGLLGLGLQIFRSGSFWGLLNLTLRIFRVQACRGCCMVFSLSNFYQASWPAWLTFGLSGLLSFLPDRLQRVCWSQSLRSFLCVSLLADMFAASMQGFLGPSLQDFPNRGCLGLACGHCLIAWH